MHSTIRLFEWFSMNIELCERKAVLDSLLAISCIHPLGSGTSEARDTVTASYEMVGRHSRRTTCQVDEHFSAS